MKPRQSRFLGLVLAACAATLANAATAEGTGNGEPAVWAPHELIVDLHDLPRHYSCNDLWYKFRGILFVLGARQDMQILPYRCEGYTPSVQLKFATPRLVTGPDAHWSELNAVARTVKIAPGSPAILDERDCELMYQVEGSLLKLLGSQVVSSQLQCRAPAKHETGSKPGKTAFDITAKVLVPVAEAASATPASTSHFEGCTYGSRDVLGKCVHMQLPPHAFANAMGDDWDCERGFTRKDDRCNPTVVPAGAHLTTFGWECDRGFQQLGQQCEKIPIPSHAFVVNDTFTIGWDCERGFMRSGSQCKPVRVPVHGFLAAAGHEWRCERGYVTANQSECLRVTVPQDGHLDETGHDWECNHGFKRVDGRCAAIKLPAHAFPTGIAELQSWHCERGYTRRGDSCVAVAIPAHAYLNDPGDGWSCDRGFHPVGQVCAPISVPRNAHLDARGNDWFCNPGFEKQAEQCAARKSAAFALAQ